MKLDRLANAILRGTWAIEPRLAVELHPLAERFARRENVDWFEAQEEKQQALELHYHAATGRTGKISADQAGTQTDDIFSEVPAGSIAVLPIQGTVMKEDYCGSVGTDTLSAWLMAAMTSPNIIGAMFDANSGGGAVEGTKELRDVVALAMAVMPVETFTDGLLCSAAYWPVAGTRITASSPTVEIGSIGVQGKFSDYSPSEAGRVTKHTITADGSPNKNEKYRQVFQGNYQPLKDSIINPLQQIFASDVFADRSDKLQLSDVLDENENVVAMAPIDGETYLAQPALELGLIDAIGTRQSVIDSIRTRAGSDEFADTKQSNNNMGFFGSKFKKLEGLKGKKAADISEGEMEAVNAEFKAEGYDNIAVISLAHVEEANAHADAVENGLSAINEALGLSADKAHTDLSAAITALAASHAEEHNRAEEFGSQPGAKPSKPKAAKDKEHEGGAPGATTTADKYETSYDRELRERQAKQQRRRTA